MLRIVAAIADPSICFFDRHRLAIVPGGKP